MYERQLMIHLHPSWCSELWHKTTEYPKGVLIDDPFSKCHGSASFDIELLSTQKELHLLDSIKES